MKMYPGPQVKFLDDLEREICLDKLNSGIRTFIAQHETIDQILSAIVLMQISFGIKLARRDIHPEVKCILNSDLRAKIDLGIFLSSTQLLEGIKEAESRYLLLEDESFPSYAYIDFVESLIYKWKQEFAREVLERYSAKFDTLSRDLLMGSLFLREGKADEAVEIFAPRENEMSVKYSFWYGCALAQAGRREQMEKALQICENLPKFHLEGLRMRDYLLKSLGFPYKRQAWADFPSGYQAISARNRLYRSLRKINRDDR
jgi:hypothetical protein